jgi:hypothetical protein
MARAERGSTPLLRAVTKDKFAVARLLVYLGADPDALDDQYDTPWLVTGCDRQCRHGRGALAYGA